MLHDGTAKTKDFFLESMSGRHSVSRLNQMHNAPREHIYTSTLVIYG